MESMEYRYETMIKESMLDVMGHLNHALYLTVYEEARWDICAAEGMTIERMQARGVGLVVIEANIQYRREVRARDQLLIKTRFLDVERKIWRVEQSMEKADGTICSSVAIRGCIFDLKQRKMMMADDEWRKVFLGSKMSAK